MDIGQLVPACRLCRSRDQVLTREHIPPKSTGNAGAHRVEVLRFDGKGPTNLELPDGLALSVLCESCNSRLGSRIGTTFATFAQQIQKSGRVLSPYGGVFACAMAVYPARVMRQLLLNFLCMQPDALDDRWDSVREYIRSRELPWPNDAPRVGPYFNMSNTYRAVPIGAVGALGQGREPWVGAELAAPGLGVVFTINDPDIANPAILGKLADISSWGTQSFGAQEQVVLSLPRYRVEAPHPLAFGSRKEVNRWQSKNMVAWLATRLETDVAPLAALLWRPDLRHRAKRRR